ncbi:MAG: acylneuraminate cytidylyltransferase family protein [Leptolyngbya sp. SIOISBB]|nr:acylneuraminate cytidylyltransferase family protein [Leptolyngbya sp. SIOISBB]
MNNELLAIVPARAGSKGVPRKNKMLVGGKPLIDYTVDALSIAKSVSGIIVTTDDPDILQYYRSHQGILLVKRPAELSQDQSKTSDAVFHALQAWKIHKGNLPRSILLAQPTTPLRTAEDIDAAFSLFCSMGKQPTISACKVDGIRHPKVMYRLGSPDNLTGSLYIEDTDNDIQRQQYEVLYQRNGAVYIVATEYFLRTGDLKSSSPVIYEMPWARSINIDIADDFKIAKALIESGLNQGQDQ